MVNIPRGGAVYPSLTRSVIDKCTHESLLWLQQYYIYQ